MLKPNLQSISVRNLSCDLPDITADNELFITELIQNSGRLPTHPPFEIHPYKSDFPLQEFEKYIIGTFPPISYILDKPQLVAAGIHNLQQPIGADGQVINLPWIPFYHGNRGSMWDFLLTNGEMDDLDNENGRQNAKKTLINFLRQNEINYADIIDSVQRGKDKDGKYDGKDKSLSNISPNNDLICHILTNRKAKYLLFNTASTFGNQGIQIWRQRNHAEFGRIRLNDNVRSFDLFVRQCHELGLGIQIRIQYDNPDTCYDWTNLTLLSPLQRSNKIAFEMKIKNPLNNPESICEGFPRDLRKWLQ